MINERAVPVDLQEYVDAVYEILCASADADDAASTLTDFFAELVDAGVEFTADELDSDTVVNAYFDPENYAEGDDAIEVEILAGDDNWADDTTECMRVAREIVDALEHELTHVAQFDKKHNKRMRKNSTPAEYMSDPDEIDAFAVNIARELTRTQGSTAAAIAKLRAGNITLADSPNLYGYIKDADQASVKRILKRTFEYLIG